LKHGIRIFFLVIGTLAVGLGILGIFMPLLPTTPLLLLAAASYARSSPRFHDWLMNHDRLGEYIRNYRDHRAIKLRAKVTAIVLLWLTIGVSIIVVDPVWLKLILGVIAAAVTAHLLSLKTLRS
jgi:uncharacterized membrane protein YbaN (DUF454 family)